MAYFRFRRSTEVKVLFTEVKVIFTEEKPRSTEVKRRVVSSGSVCTALRAPCFLPYGGTGEGETSEPASAGALLAGGERGAPRPSHTPRIGDRLRRFP